jgi:hypothetical protein
MSGESRMSVHWKATSVCLHDAGPASDCPKKRQLLRSPGQSLYHDHGAWSQCQRQPDVQEGVKGKDIPRARSCFLVPQLKWTCSVLEIGLMKFKSRQRLVLGLERDGVGDVGEPGLSPCTGSLLSSLEA